MNQTANRGVARLWIPMIAGLVLAAASSSGVVRAAGAPIFGADDGDAQGPVWVLDQAGTPLDRVLADFTEDDALAVGDVNGDGVDEIVIAGNDTSTIDIFDLAGNKIGSFIGSYDDTDDGFAVGNLDGFVGDEILIADVDTGIVDVYKGNGQKIASFNGDYTEDDGFAAGDIDGDGIDEILIAGDVGHVVDVFDIFGAKVVPSFATAYDEDDEFAVGDLDGDGTDEALVAHDDDEVVRAYDRFGQLISAHDDDFTEGDLFAAGDVDADGADEIVIWGDVNQNIDIFEGSGQKKTSFHFTGLGVTLRHAFTVGRHDYPDQDGDGLLDGWETDGLDADGNGTIDVDLPAMGADPLHKDLFLELDWDNVAPPNQRAITRLKAAFAAAPIDAGGVVNPDGQPGITVHVDTGGLTDPNGSEAPGLAAGSCSDGIDNDGDSLVDLTDPGCLVGDNFGGGNALNDQGICGVDDDTFYTIKSGNFSTARRAVFRYAISGNGSGCGTGGQGEIGGNDFIEYNHDGGTIMHELGHTLGLRHGGHSDHNCKPNYISVMNYNYQFGIPRFGASAVIDYAPVRLPGGGRAAAPLGDLPEDSLNEQAVLDPGDSASMVVYTGDGGVNLQSPVGQPIDWDGDGSIEILLVQANIDDDGNNGPAACDNGDDDIVLHGSEDWSRIALRFRQFFDASDGAVNPGPEDEPTLAEMQALQDALNTTDLSLTLAASPEPVAAGTPLTYTLTVTNEGPNPANQPRVTQALPAGVAFQNATTSCTPAGATLICDLAAMAVNDAITVQITVLVAADLVYLAGGPTTISSTATIQNLTGPDAEPADNTATADTLVVAVADLAITGFEAATVPPQIVIGDGADLVLRTFVASGGPSSPMDASLVTTATAAPGASVAPPSSSAIAAALAVGTPQAVEQTFTLQCSQPGFHSFTFHAALAPLHPADTDPDPSNNEIETTLSFDCVVPVAVNIKPGSNPNSINIPGDTVAVAVLTTIAGEYGLPLAFDATTIKPLTVKFGEEGPVAAGTGGTTEVHKTGHVENSIELPPTPAGRERIKDGDKDMVLHFASAVSGLSAADVKACVKGDFIDPGTGETFRFFGCDAVRIVQ